MGEIEMTAKMSKEEAQRYTSLELRELGSLEGKVTNAMACQDYDKAKMYAVDMFKIKDRVDQREYREIMSLSKKEVNEIMGLMDKTKIEVKTAKAELKNEALEVMKLPTAKRNEYYAKVKQERGEMVSAVLVSEVKKQRQISQGIER